jgi:hypothetical protein
VTPALTCWAFIFRASGAFTGDSRSLAKTTLGMTNEGGLFEHCDRRHTINSAGGAACESPARECWVARVCGLSPGGTAR